METTYLLKCPVSGCAHVTVREVVVAPSRDAGDGLGGSRKKHTLTFKFNLRFCQELERQFSKASDKLTCVGD